MAKTVTVDSSSRLRRGVGIVAGLKTVETARIEDRLKTFVKAQEGLTQAQTVLDAAEVKVKEVRAHIADCDAKQAAALEALARALVFDGQPRAKPFLAFGGLTPGKLKALPAAEEAAATHALVAAIRAAKNQSKATLEAAAAADKTATKLESAPATLPKLEAACDEARHTRDSLQQEWDQAERLLKRLCRLVEEEHGVPLYSRGFPRRSRSTGKSSKAAARAVNEAPAAPAADASVADPDATAEKGKNR